MGGSPRFALVLVDWQESTLITDRAADDTSIENCEKWCNKWAVFQVGKFTFLVESVLKLMDFLEEEGKDPTLATSEACRDPRLPEECNPVCEEADAPDIFMKLSRYTPVDRSLLGVLISNSSA